MSDFFRFFHQHLSHFHLFDDVGNNLTLFMANYITRVETLDIIFLIL